jgi:hypothetical protein
LLLSFPLQVSEGHALDDSDEWTQRDTRKRKKLSSENT